MSSRLWNLLCEPGYPLRPLGPDRGARGRHPHRGVLVLPSRAWHQLSTPSKPKISALLPPHSCSVEDLHRVGGGGGGARECGFFPPSSRQGYCIPPRKLSPGLFLSLCRKPDSLSVLTVSRAVWYGTLPQHTLESSEISTGTLS